MKYLSVDEALRPGVDFGKVRLANRGVVPTNRIF